jgi:hypothetical protein
LSNDEAVCADADAPIDIANANSQRGFMPCPR